MSLFSRLLSGGRGLTLRQNLGAYRKPDGDVSPLYVFFDVENPGPESATVTAVRVSPKGEPIPLASEDLEGDLPARLAPGESVRFRVRAKALARAAQEAGHTGRPKLTFVATDAQDAEHRHGFRLRVDEYLELKDE